MVFQLSALGHDNDVDDESTIYTFVSSYVISNAMALPECPIRCLLMISAVHGKMGTATFAWRQTGQKKKKKMEQEKEISARRATFLYPIEKASASTSS